MLVEPVRATSRFAEPKHGVALRKPRGGACALHKIAEKLQKACREIPRFLPKQETNEYI